LFLILLVYNKIVPVIQGKSVKTYGLYYFKITIFNEF